MAENIEFELVAPEKLISSGPVEMVVVPGGEGDFGVLKGHAPLISTVRPGVIETYEAGVVKDRIFVAGGFAEVTAERCTVLAEQASRVADLDRGAIERELSALREELAAAKDSAREAIDRKIAVAEAKLAITA